MLAVYCEASKLLAAHKIFGFDAERVRQPGKVVEEGHHLGGVVDLDIAPANRPQRIDCLSRNLVDVARHLDGEIEQGTRLGINRSLAVISLDLVRQFGVARYGTEILSVGLRSIKAIVRPRGDRRKHLALASREASRAVHQRDVEPRRSGEHGRVQALHPDYVEDTPGALFCLLVIALEFTSRLVWGDGIDPGHGFPPSRQAGPILPRAQPNGCKPCGWEGGPQMTHQECFGCPILCPRRTKGGAFEFLISIPPLAL